MNNEGTITNKQNATLAIRVLGPGGAPLPADKLVGPPRWLFDTPANASLAVTPSADGMSAELSTTDGETGETVIRVEADVQEENGQSTATGLYTVKVVEGGVNSIEFTLTPTPRE